jgi:PBSX family phage terminase large subunit
VPTIRPFGAKAARFIRRPISQDAPINILHGAIRSAKTWAMIPKLIALATCPIQGAGLITGYSKSTIKKNILNDLFNIIGPKRYKYNESTGELLLCGRQCWVVGAKDEGSWKTIRGSTFGWWYGDELTLTPKSFFDMALSRLSIIGARMYGTTNPGNPSHYIKTDYLDNEKLRASGDIWSEHFVLDDNPNLDPAFKERLRRQHTGVFKQWYIDGLWVIAEGAIYRDSLREVEGVKSVFYSDGEQPAGLHSPACHLQRVIAVDYGTVNPTVFIDIYDDGKTVWWDREYYYDSKAQLRQKTDGEYADDLVGFIGRDNNDDLTRHLVIVDPSAASFKVECMKRGIAMQDADNEVTEGIRLLSSALSQRLVRINRDKCPNGVREMETYAWDEKASDGGDEQPIKKHDHYPDAGRYWAKTLLNPWRLAA